MLFVADRCGGSFGGALVDRSLQIRRKKARHMAQLCYLLLGRGTIGVGWAIPAFPTVPDQEPNIPVLPGRRLADNVSLQDHSR